MNNKQFFNNLSATYADIRKLDVKKINLKGKNILEYIKESVPVILDERGTNADDELDIWNSYVTTDENGNVIINRSAKPFEHTKDTISSTQSTTLRMTATVIDNEVFDEFDEHLMYWQTNGLTDGQDMFFECSSLRLFSSDLSSLINGNGMFYGCYDFNSFNSDLSSLTTGEHMFHGCYGLTSFNSDLPSLTNGNIMFSNCTSLESFSSDLSSLTSGMEMFVGCYNLTSFSSDLSSLTDGNGMFCGCSFDTFTSDLSSLTSGYDMFSNCKLDASSVANIIHFIPQRDAKPTSTTDSGNITIGIGITNTDAAKQAFAEECYCDDWAELNKEFDDKNWVVEWQFNGEATTFDLRSPKPSTAVYAKLEEVTMPTNEKEHKPRYAYTSQDGSKFYNIHWYHDSNTNNEGYDYFESLEEAISAYGVIHK